MNIDLGLDYTVRIDTYNHTLSKKYYLNKKTGESYSSPKEEFVGYYPNMEQAIKGAIKYESGNEEFTTNLEGYLEKIIKLWEAIGNEYKRDKN